MSLLDAILETNLLPDAVIRVGIRRLLAQTLREKHQPSPAHSAAALRLHVDGLKRSPIAIQTQAANQQHYEIPTRFYQLVLGPRLKYSSGYWAEPDDTLAQSEDNMLALTCQRAEIADGQEVLELGCGWGSLSLWMAEFYPRARITAVSNSRSQKEYIDAEASRRGLKNLTVLTRDVNTLELDGSFDRVVSVEMFEHMKNYQLLMRKIAGWLRPGGRLFVHIFTHREHAYHFEDRGPDDWMARYFFSGGQMPSADLLLHFQDDLTLEQQWQVTGIHYQKTAEAWLKKMDAHRPEIWRIFEQTYGPGETRRWWAYWRIFFMSCAELFGYDHGGQWCVSHYRFRK
jgi:cyclopropane-fatty-acyl-phospholipid synthase